MVEGKIYTPLPPSRQTRQKFKGRGKVGRGTKEQNFPLDQVPADGEGMTKPVGGKG